MSWVRVPPEAADFSLEKSLSGVFVLCFFVGFEGVFQIITLGTHAHEGNSTCLVCVRVYVCVCPSVCLSVTTLASTSLGT